MAYKVVIGKSARLDLQNVLDWYVGESIAALESFVSNLYARFDDLAKHPESFGQLRQRPRFRKTKINRFPYYIVYRVDENRSRVFVSAIIHEKRNPEVWIARLR